MNEKEVWAAFFILVGIGGIVFRKNDDFQKRMNKLINKNHSDRFYIISNMIGGIMCIVVGLLLYFNVMPLNN